MSEQLLTILKLCLLVLLYLFFLRVLRAVWAEIGPEAGRAAARLDAPARIRPGLRARPAARQLAVVEPVGQRGRRFPLGQELTVGRALPDARSRSTTPTLHRSTRGSTAEMGSCSSRTLARRTARISTGRRCRARWSCSVGTSSRSATRSWSWCDFVPGGHGHRHRPDPDQQPGLPSDRHRSVRGGRRHGWATRAARWLPPWLCRCCRSTPPTPTWNRCGKASSAPTG